MKIPLLSVLLSLVDHSKVRIFIPSIAGFFFYGAWALFINSEHGWLVAGKAALAQGSYSFMITLVLALMIEWLFIQWQNVVWRGVWVFIVTLLVLTATSSVLNFVVGTPNILWTILPGLLVSSVYSVIYIIALHRCFTSQ